MDMEIHERVIVDGNISKLVTPLIHKDFKSLSKYIDRHNAYSTWEANLRFKFFKTGKYGEDTVRSKLFGNSQERKRWLKILIMRLPFEHWFWFFYHYIICLGFLNGRRGLIACQIRANYIQQVNSKIKEILGKGFSSHSFRQGLITEMGSKSINIKIISQFVGHKNVSTTMGYIKPTDEQIINCLVR